jgi:hypothetical protein
MAMPVSLVAGNLLVAIVFAANTASTTVTAFTSGWTLLATSHSTVLEIGQYIYYKVAGGADTFSITFSNQSNVGAQVIQFANANAIGMTAGSWTYDTAVNPPYHAASDSGVTYLALVSCVRLPTTAPTARPAGFSAIKFSKTTYGFTDVSLDTAFKALDTTESVDPDAYTYVDGHSLASTYILHWGA